MTRTFNISGSETLGRNILRSLVLLAATIGGFFILTASALFAFFIAAGLFVLGAIAFAFFWGRAKILGKPFGPRAQFEAAQAEMEARMRGTSVQADDGPIIDAHQTPEGWSVDR